VCDMYVIEVCVCESVCEERISSTCSSMLAI